MKRFLILSFFFAFCAWGEVRVPRSWYSDQISEQKGLFPADLSEYVQFLLGVQGKVLERSRHYLPKVKGWKMSRFNSKFSIGQSGSFGLAGLGVRQSVDIMWVNKNYWDRGLDIESKAKTPTTMIEGPQSQKNITSALLPLRELTPVQHRNVFDRQLENLAKKLSFIFTSLDSYTPLGWEAKLLITYFNVNARGQIKLGEVSGGSGLTLVWKRSGRPVEEEFLSENGKRVHQWARTIGKSLTQISHRAVNGFKLSSVGVGIGLDVGGNVGVARLGASAGGLVIFLPTNEQQDGKIQNKGISQELSIVEDGENKQNSSRTMKNIEGQFQTALKRATFFSRQVKKGTGSWEVEKVATYFDLSQRGNLVLAQAGGRLSVSLTMRRVKK